MVMHRPTAAKCRKCGESMRRLITTWACEACGEFEWVRDVSKRLAPHKELD